MGILKADTIHGLTVGLLAAKYDNPKPIPEFHDEMWDLCCSDEKLVAIAAPRGHAKAQSLESKVLTPTGWRKIGDLQKGDWVIGDGGEDVLVTHTHPIEEMDLYRVTTADGKSTLCNLDHLWLCEIPGNKPGPQLKTLREILKNWKSPRFDKRNGKEYTEYRYRIPAIDPVQFEEAHFHVDPYTLGVWLGDGHSAGGRITSGDIEVINAIPYPTTKQAGKYLYGVEGLTERLSEYDLLDNKHIPEKYLRGSIDQRLALLRGLMDADGTCHKTHGQVSFCNTNKRIIDGVVALVRSLGGIATVSSGTARLYGKNCGPYWKVTVKMAVTPFSLERKTRYWSPHKRLYSYITGIEYEKTDLGRCISVEGRLYVTDDYLLTHNSTAITHAFILASVLFREKSFVLLVSDTESQASGFLVDIANEVTSNTALRSTFGIKKVLKSTETVLVVMFKDGEKFRIVAKGSEQKLRGLKWNNKRPDLIVGDDLENDEIVMNPERREKFRKWVMNALIPCGSDTCTVRFVGTILHLDSMLNRLMKNKKWTTLIYEACDENFENVLWVEKFSPERLLDIYENYVEEGNSEGFSQEYRNQPVDIKNLFFKKDYFIDFQRDEDGNAMLPNLNYFAAADFAISEKQKADYTAIVVVGVDPDSKLYVVDVRRFKGDTKDIIDELIATQTMWDVNMWMFESGQISKSLEPFLITEMHRTGTTLNYVTHTPTQSKTMRARSIQGKHKSGFIRYDKEKEWWPAFEAELLMVADSGPRGRNDDQFDAFAYTGLTVDQFFEAYSDEELEEEEYQSMFDEEYDQGRCASTGY